MLTNSSSVSRLRNAGLKRTLTAAAAMGGTTTSLMTANAAIVYSGLQNLSTSSQLGADDVKSVNIDDNGPAEFSLFSFNAKGSDFHSLSFQSPGFGAVGHPSFGSYVLKMEAGATIGPDSNFGGFPLIDNQTDFLYSLEPDTVWNSGSDSYIGFRFNPSGSQDLYGWGHVTISADRTLMTLVDWAYENTGAPIRAGIPEPTTSLLLTGGLLVVGLWRRCVRRGDR